VLRDGWGVFYQQTDRYGSESQLDSTCRSSSMRRSSTGADAPAFSRAGLYAADSQTVNPPVQWRIRIESDTPVVSIQPDLNSNSPKAWRRC
jgi:hypothetical protein